MLFIGRLGLSGPLFAYLASSFGLALFSLSYYWRSIRDPRRALGTIGVLVITVATVAAESAICLTSRPESLARIPIPVAWSVVVLSVLFWPRARAILLPIPAKTEVAG